MDHNLFVRRADWYVEDRDTGHYRPYRSLYGHRVRRKRVYGHHFTHVMYGGHNSRLLFQKKADWKAVVRLLPAAVAGFFIAIWVDDQIPASDFRFLLGITLLTVFLVMLWSEFTGSQNRWAHAWWFAPFFGLLGGFVTMIGNAAGAVMAIYLLSMRKEKMEFIGTNAWFFMVVNLLKLPLQILVWHNITFESFRLNLLMLPFLGLGACIGLRIVRRFSDQSFHRFIQIVTAFSVVLMITR